MRMLKLTTSIGAVGIAIALASTGVSAHGPEQKTVTAQGTGAPVFDETVRLAFEHAIPNIKGKSLIALEVTYPPGGKSPSHHHPSSAFIYAHILSGAIRSQVDNEPARVYRAGEGFYEVPGSHHRVSENASQSEPASLLAVFVVDSQDKPLVLPDQK